MKKSNELEQAEARENVEWRFEAIYAEGGRQALDAYERAIRASERAKYAALMEAVVVRHGGMHAPSITECDDPLCATLAALQANE